MTARPLPALFLSLLLLIGVPAAGAQPLRPLVEEPVPLILKDGRIAEVSIFAVPFITASSEMPAGVEDELREIIARFATDCFLTAQVIGHVEPGPEKDGGTLAAHRLARTRAERIQELMTERGLPATSIASVWDWQFSTKESRATVWFFTLDSEEECRGEPALADASETPPDTAGEEAVPPERPLVASDDADQTVGGPAPVPDGNEAPAARAESGAPAGVEEPAPLTVTVRRPEEVPPRSDGATAPADTSARDAAGPGAETETAAAEAETAAPPRPLTEEGDTRPAPASTAASAGAKASPPVERLRAETEPGEVLPRVALSPESGNAEASSATTVPAAADSGAQEPGTEPEVEIVFDLNSSWLPHGAGRELARLLKRLEGGRYALEIVAAVDNGPIKNGSPEDARRYNRWLAERRANRVAEWLRRRGDGVIAGIEQRFREDDPSRKVVIRARRLP